MLRRRILNCLLGICVCSSFMSASPTNSFRAKDFNFGWKFKLLKDTVSLRDLPLADEKWRVVRLPHDWSVESSFDSRLEGCTGYLPGGVGVYQKHFKVEKSVSKSTFVLFDGVYNNAKFWLNGKYLGENPYGYSPTYFDLTAYLNNNGQDNVLTVYVDHSHYADCRWYTGSGIYRNVKLVTVDKLHIPIWGTFVTTPYISKERADINVEVTVDNMYDNDSEFKLSTFIYEKCGKCVATCENSYIIGAGQSQKFHQKLRIAAPKLWDTENPNMYRAVTIITKKGEKIDEYETPFGIRSLVFDKDKGFFLNGNSTYVKGVCLHHDGGMVGAAVPEGVWRRRFKELKEGGCNAIRTSHNPFSQEFLDLCDEMGFLVQNEIFDEMDNPKDKRYNFEEKEPLYRTEGYTNHFQKWGESDLKRTIKRDRNHPCVFEYSIGNEIEWTYPDYKYVSGLWDPDTKGGYWNKIPHLTPEQMKARYDSLPARKYVLAETAQRLSKWVKEVDTTRPVTANLIIPVASCVTGYADALDVVGFSYQIKQYDWCKKNFPNMMFTGSENTGLLEEWKSITDNPMVFSMYMWTGIDYMGESTNMWPQKAWDGDMLDLAGFRKAGWNHFRSVWRNEPFMALQTHLADSSLFKVDDKSGKVVAKSPKAMNWDNVLSQEMWNYKNGEMVIVELASNVPEAVLYLNGKSLGSISMKDCKDNVMRWAVPYEKGELVAVANVGGKEVKSTLRSAGKPAKLQVSVDKTSLLSDGYDVAHIIVQIVDKDGIPVRNMENNVTFSVKGDVSFLGVDNGWNKSTQDFKSKNVTTHLGRCLSILQSNKDKKGEVNVKVSVKGLPSHVVKLHVK